MKLRDMSTSFSAVPFILHCELRKQQSTFTTRKSSSETHTIFFYEIWWEMCSSAIHNKSSNFYLLYCKYIIAARDSQWLTKNIRPVGLETLQIREKWVLDSLLGTSTTSSICTADRASLSAETGPPAKRNNKTSISQTFIEKNHLSPVGIVKVIGIEYDLRVVHRVKRSLPSTCRQLPNRDSQHPDTAVLGEFTLWHCQLMLLIKSGTIDCTILLLSNF